MNSHPRYRIHGESHPALQWINDNPRLPSRIGETRIAVDDVDIFEHAFLMPVDRIGTRELQCMMFIEIKTRGGEPSPSQRDDWFKMDCFNGSKNIGGQLVKFWGVFVWKLSGTNPDDSRLMEWGAYRSDGTISYSEIDIATLEELLLFQRNPRNLENQAFRRHHKTREFAIQTRSPLGFYEFVRVRKSS